MENKVKKSWRAESRKDWISNLSEGESLSHDAVRTGAIMRMADSMETIAKDRIELERNVVYWKDACKRRDGEITTLNNRIRGLQGFITRLKAKIFRLGGTES